MYLYVTYTHFWKLTSWNLISLSAKKGTTWIYKPPNLGFHLTLLGTNIFPSQRYFWSFSFSGLVRYCWWLQKSQTANRSLGFMIYTFDKNPSIILDYSLPTSTGDLIPDFWLPSTSNVQFVWFHPTSAAAASLGVGTGNILRHVCTCTTSV